MNIDALSKKLADFITAQERHPYLFGISGGQGAGKSTLCGAIENRLAAKAISCVTLGLDDFYLPKAARYKLADTVSPLCSTRGVPGTHNIALLRATLDRLQHAQAQVKTPLPTFSKSHDEQIAPQDWSVFKGRPDVILLEGWCVGGRADYLANTQPTAWEQTQDPLGIWKNWTLAQVAPYEAVWDLCDDFLLLRHENFDAVIDSRWQQEQTNAAASGVWQFASRDEVAAFCAHYESWTRAIWRHLPAHARFSFRREQDTYLSIA